MKFLSFSMKKKLSSLYYFDMLITITHNFLKNLYFLKYFFNKIDIFNLRKKSFS